jgi:hypothetical protein
MEDFPIIHPAIGEMGRCFFDTTINRTPLQKQMITVLSMLEIQEQRRKKNSLTKNDSSARI